jgi:hypothetical protein
MIPERPINLPFFMKDNTKLIPIEATNQKEICEGCLFEHIECVNLIEQTGHCTSVHRADNIDVIFVSKETL